MPLKAGNGLVLVPLHQASSIVMTGSVWWVFSDNPYHHEDLTRCLKSSAEDIDTSGLLTDATQSEVYIRSMLTSGKGLASWRPGPPDGVAGRRGVVPGDVGTFRANDGFQRIFNLWEDQDAIRSSGIFGETYTPPKMDAVTHKGDLSAGDTIARGTSAVTEYASDGG